MERIICESCGSEIERGKEYLREKDKVVGCDICSGSIQYQSDLSKEDKNTDFSHGGNRGKIPIPNGMKISNTQEGLIIERKWSGCLSFSLLFFFAIPFSGLFLLFFVTALRSLQFPEILAYIPFLIAIAAIDYVTMVFMMNKTFISIKNNEIIIRYGPLKWKKGKSFHIATLSQFYGQKRKSFVNGRHKTSYRLMAKQKGSGKGMLILDGFSNILQAQFVEQEIENYLGITNKKVRGEYRD